MLITVDKIKKIVPISPNIDSSKISALIFPVEQRHIQPLLGSLLFADIEAKYANQTLNDMEQGLVTILQMAIAYLVIYDLLPFLSFSITDKGIQQQSGVNSNPADNASTTASMTYIRNELKNKYEFAMETGKSYLDVNQLSFPLYNVPGNVPDSKTQYDSGIAFYDTDLNTISKGYYL